MMEGALEAATKNNRFPTRVPIIGYYSRYMIGSHVWHIQIVLVMLVCIVLAVDISPWVGSVWSGAASKGMILSVAAVLRFSTYRALDITAQVFPIACVLGMFWTEAAHSGSGQRLIILTTGRSHFRSTTPLVVIALAATIIQFGLDNHVRPLAVMQLIKEQLGSYHNYVDRGAPDQSIWLSLGDDILRAKVDPAEPAFFAALEYYRFGKHTLRDVTIAAEARPTASGDTRSWLFLDGKTWAFSRDKRHSSAGSATRYPSETFEMREVELPVDPLWLRYRGIEPKYLPAAVLRMMAQSQGIPSDQPNYAAWLQLRTAQAFIPGMLGLLAAAIFYLLYDRFSSTFAGMVSLALGYFGFAFMRLMTVIGEHAIVPPLIAAWSLPAMLLISSAAAFWQLAKYDRAFPKRF
jgi:lipopolysaccharide export LptBFGC system permease protein LptF